MLEVVVAALLVLVLGEYRCPSPIQGISAAKGLSVTLSWPLGQCKACSNAISFLVSVCMFMCHFYIGFHV